MARPFDEAYEQSADRALTWLEGRLREDGSFGLAIADLACYYKSPYLFLLCGKVIQANRLLTSIKERFLQANGDFTTDGAMKSVNGALVEYWSYTNGWIAMAAQRMGRFDVAYPAYRYLQTFAHPELGGFTTTKPYGEGDNGVDVLTTAHLGLASLYFGDVTRATRAGALLARFVSAQPDLRSGLYLRMDLDGHLLTSYPPERSLFYLVSATEPQQAYFMIGYPIGFLGKLYQATGDERHLHTARRYQEFALSCHGDLRAFHFSHKVAWGAAVLAGLTGERRYADLAGDIARYLVSIQDREGAWLQEQPAHTSFDQTTEIAIWLKEISAELRALS